jgi:hypothetical protein
MQRYFFKEETKKDKKGKTEWWQENEYWKNLNNAQDGVASAYQNYNYGFGMW